MKEIEWEYELKEKEIQYEKICQNFLLLKKNLLTYTLKKKNSGYQKAFIFRLDLLRKRKMSDYHYARSYTL